jgi:NADPH:quinone reductase-like Zn-dependent oxidoreductase
MKAVYINEFGKKEKLIYSELFHKPEVKEGEVLVHIKAAGVNPVDYKIRNGLRMNLTHNFPLILGWDMAGVVEERGFAARHFELGDEVFAYARRPIVEKGTYAEYISIPECYLALKPTSMSFEEAASVPLVGLTAYQVIHEKTKIKPGQIILILGASGGVGSMAVQLAKIAGAKVAALASAANSEYIKKLGADYVLNYDQDNWLETFNNLFPQKADVVFDFVGSGSLIMAQNCIKAGGILISIAGQIDPATADTLGFQFIYHFVEPNAKQLQHLATLADTGLLKTHIHHIFQLKDASLAHEMIESGHVSGKIVLAI